MVSGPVHSTDNDFVVWYAQIEDVTNNALLQPDWWPGEAPDCPCGASGEESCYDGQIWRVTLVAELVPGGYQEEVGWLYVCEADSPSGASSYSATFTVSITDVEQVTACEYRVSDSSAYTARFESCMDAEGDPVTLEIAQPMIPGPWAAEDTFAIAGTVDACLHKGTAGRNYVTHEMLCNVFDIDLEEWDEVFGGGDYRGYAAEDNEARWEAVNNSVVNDCADRAWVCRGPGAGDPDLRVDDAGRVWLAMGYGVKQGGDIRVYHRDSPQREWEEHEPAFEEMQHSDPSILPLADGTIMVAATRWRGKTELMMSPDDGMSWKRPA